jgi:hypothetical protein
VGDRVEQWAAGSWPYVLLAFQQLARPSLAASSSVADCVCALPPLLPQAGGLGVLPGGHGAVCAFLQHLPALRGLRRQRHAI